MTDAWGLCAIKPVIISLFRTEGNYGHEHFFHGDASVLEGVGVVLRIVVIVVGICEEIVVAGEDVSRRDVGRRQAKGERFLYLIHLLRIVVEGFTHLVTQVGVDIFVAGLSTRMVPWSVVITTL